MHIKALQILHLPGAEIKCYISLDCAASLIRWEEDDPPPPGQKRPSKSARAAPIPNSPL